ncbi:hypothetical protein [Spirosoma sp.]|uniref:hypothetical protein n=1 Tax=Spirosoma sp. TaxID=1899569 RepID=UPI002621D329|nr:hypothetical protein [Spirosoma sp.]MCX6216371.1 hypothetical protein [Spirosoma sp.]
MLTFFGKPALKAAQSLTELRHVEIETLYVAVSLHPEGKKLLATQLERDIDGKSRGWNPVPFTLLQLQKFDQLLKRKPESDLVDDVLFTHEERKELAMYAVRYFVMARDSEDVDRATAYKLLISSLLELSTLIRLPL